jgi:serine/threonine protein kinase
VRVVDGFDVYEHALEAALDRPGRVWLVMQPLVDMTLTELLKEMAYKLVLMPKEIMVLIDDILAGVEFIHDQGFMHLDIKLGNIEILLLGVLRRIVMLDLGCCTECNKSRDHRVGTASFMAPEVLDLRRRWIKNERVTNMSADYRDLDELPEFTTKADVFSTALCCLEILRDQRNVKLLYKYFTEVDGCRGPAKITLAIVLDVLGGEQGHVYPSMRELFQLLKKTLEKNGNDRSSAKDLRRELKSMMNELDEASEGRTLKPAKEAQKKTPSPNEHTKETSEDLVAALSKGMSEASLTGASERRAKKKAKLDVDE